MTDPATSSAHSSSAQPASVVRLDLPGGREVIHRDVAANGARFHIAETGDGPLVMLVHGFPQFWWTWRHQLAALADAGFRAVAMDLRGVGGSDRTPGVTTRRTSPSTSRVSSGPWASPTPRWSAMTWADTWRGRPR